jgi:drug/metabolite transporter (DMT)-like permease
VTDDDPAAHVGMRPGLLDSTLMGVGVVAVSTSGPLMAAMVVPAMAIAFWRTALGAALTAPWVVAGRRREVARLDRRQWRLVLGSGALLACHFAAWVPSLTMTSVASATALVCLQPVWTAFLAKTRGYPLARRAWWGIALAVVGAVLLSGVDLSFGPSALLGDVLALVGGFFGAAYVTVGQEVRRDVSTPTYTTLCYATTAALLLVVCVAAGQRLGGYDARSWVQIAALTLGAQLLGHTLFNVVLRTTSSTTVSVVILLEVPGAALLAAWFLDQTPPALALPAIVLMLGGIAMVVATPSTGTAAAVPVE